MRIDVIDQGDPAVAKSCEQQVQGYTEGIIKMWPMSNGIVQMVDDVINAVASSNALTVLRIWGHGWAGGQLIAGGPGSRSAVWGGNVFDFAWSLQRLADVFTPDGHVELKGCQVAGADVGKLFLAKLAITVGRSVLAGENTQGGPNSAQITPGVGWDGPVFQADPDGSVYEVQPTPL